MANTSQAGLINQGALVGVIFALLAAVGFSARAILVKLAYLDRVDAVTLLALRMAFSSSVSTAGVYPIKLLPMPYVSPVHLTKRIR